MKEFGFYKICPIPDQFGIVSISDLATFHPMQLHTVSSESNEQFTVCSLRNKPIIFAK